MEDPKSPKAIMSRKEAQSVMAKNRNVQKQLRIMNACKDPVEKMAHAKNINKLLGRYTNE